MPSKISAADLDSLSRAIQELRVVCTETHSHLCEYGSSGYKDAIRHFLESSSEVAQIAIVPADAQALSKIMLVLKKYDTVKFAVRGGGHAMAPGYSSTTGIHISLSHFDQVIYDEETSNVEVGAGCLWDQVYSSLAEQVERRNVIGGSASQGVGVAGWLLGGGYSLKSNRYGLGIDNIVAYEIVLPDGSIKWVTIDSDKLLFNALRGGGNNFGIVTRFVLKTYRQEHTYGANLTFPIDRVEDVKKAIVQFVQEESRKGAMIVSAFRHVLDRGKQEIQSTISVMCVYDGPKPRRKNDIPFQEFSRLSREGTAFGADPAGWDKESGGLFEVSTEKVVKPDILAPRMLSTNVNSSAKTSRAAHRATGSGSEADADVDSDLESEVGYENNAFYETDYTQLSQLSTNLYSGALYDQVPTTASYSLDAPMSSLRVASSFAVSNSLSQGVAESGADSDADDSSDDDAPRDVRQAQHRAHRKSSHNNSASSTSANDSTTFEWSAKSADEETDATSLDIDSDEAYISDPEIPSPPKPKRRFIYRTKATDSMGELKERGRFACLMISTFTQELIDVVQQEAQKCASFLQSKRGLSVIIDVWPVHEGIFDNSPPGAAFPHVPGKPLGPLLAYFRWQNSDDDEFWLAKLKGSLNRIRAVAQKSGLTPAKPAYYSNLSLETTPVHRIYRDSLPWLIKAKQQYDPTNVMGRAGGHKIPLA